MTKPEAGRLATMAFEEAEITKLRMWMTLSGGQKVDLFEAIIELSYRSGALAPERVAVSD